jgi:polyferredoxin
MLRFIRTFIALILFVSVTLLFLDFTGTVIPYCGWIAKLQVVPALLSLNVVAIAVLALLTLVFGRVYCSVLCPMGVFQDIISRLHLMAIGKKRRKIGKFAYHTPRTKTRRIILACFIVLIALGLVNLLTATIASLIEPYSAYGRMVTALFSPLYDASNNLLANWAEKHDSYMFYTVAHHSSWLIYTIATLTFIAVGFLAWITGRDYCNTVCPVGTLLGFISKHSLLRPVINLSKCNGCRSCERHCKASCIDAKHHEIDLSRCVACMDCVSACKQHAISYTRNHKTAIKQNYEPTDTSRRQFMAVLGLATGAVAATAADKFTDGGLTALKPKTTPVRKVRITPPGSQGHAHLNQHCIGCQLCVQACPSGILKTSTNIDSLMQPYVDYTDGFCPPECTRCSQVCPAGAFHPLDEALKSSTKIGTAVVNYDTCLLATEGIDCGNCARHCPAGAISIVSPGEEYYDMPVVAEQACIGCGACEYHCPVGSVQSMDADSSAIHVEGIQRHRTI